MKHVKLSGFATDCNPFFFDKSLYVYYVPTLSADCKRTGKKKKKTIENFTHLSEFPEGNLLSILVLTACVPLPHRIVILA